METDLFIFSIIVLIFSVIIHEVAHGWAANSLGDPTAKLAGRLTLNPIRHIDPVGTILIPLLLKLSGSPFLFGWAKPVPYNPYNLRNQRWGEAFVAVAGVATNLFLAILFGLLARYSYAHCLSPCVQLFPCKTLHCARSVPLPFDRRSLVVYGVVADRQQYCGLILFFPFEYNAVSVVY